MVSCASIVKLFKDYNTMAIDTTRTPYTLDINPIKQGDDFVETFVFSITELDLIDLVSAQIDFIDRNGVKKFSYTLGAGITKISQTLYLDISRSQTLTFEIGSNVYTYELELVIGNFKRTYVEGSITVTKDYTITT